MAKRKVQETVPQAIPETAKCPFTGQELQLLKSENSGSWRASGEFWFTRWFPTKQELMFELHKRNGKEPGFKRRTEIKVREIEPPPPPDPVSSEAKEFEESAWEFVEKLEAEGKIP